MREGGADAICASAALENFVFDYKTAVFVGECGLDEKANFVDPARYLSWLQLGLAFLRANFDMPQGCRLGLAWFQYIGDPFPVIALAWDSTDPALNVDEVSTHMDKIMREFNRLINWRALSDLLDASQQPHQTMR